MNALSLYFLVCQCLKLYSVSSLPLSLRLRLSDLRLLQQLAKFCARSFRLFLIGKRERGESRRTIESQRFSRDRPTRRVILVLRYSNDFAIAVRRPAQFDYERLQFFGIFSFGHAEPAEERRSGYDLERRLNGGDGEGTTKDAGEGGKKLEGRLEWCEIVVVELGFSFSYVYGSAGWKATFCQN